MIIYASLITSTVRADSIDFSGYIGADLSYFPNTGLYPGQLGDLQYSLVLAPEIKWQSDSGNTQINVLAFGRIDSSDTKRQHIDLRSEPQLVKIDPGLESCLSRSFRRVSGGVGFQFFQSRGLSRRTRG